MLARVTRGLLGRRSCASFDTDWVPQQYLADYYSVVEPDERETIAFFVDAMKAAPPGEPVLVFGSGPTLHHVFLAAPAASELHLADYLPANLAEIERWRTRDPAAHDWRAFVRYTLECEGLAAPTEDDVTRREELTRSKITRLLQADARRSAPLDQRYATVISAYCADSATDDRAMWETLMTNITGLVSPGGLFITAALRRCRSYRVGDQALPLRQRRRARPPARARLRLHPARAGPRAGGARAAGLLQRRPRGRATVMTRPPPRRTAAEAAARLIGADTVVPCVDGRSRRYVNLDYAASTPVMAAVWDAVEAFVPWYSSVHRGSGVKSQISTAAFEDARETIAEFVGGRADDAVVFVRNTTEAINVLAAALPDGRAVCSRARSSTTPTCSPGVATLSGCSRSPARRTSCWTRVSGRFARHGRGSTWSPSPAPRTSPGRCGRSPSWPSSPMPTEPSCSSTPRSSPPTARSTWPARASTSWRSRATSSTHRSEPARWSATAAASSERAPLLHGGGAIELVTPDEVIWADAPQRHEAGSPNVVGAVALAAACRALLDLGMDTVAAHEQALADTPVERACRRPGAATADALARATSTASASPPSTSTATGIRCSPPSSAPSTRSASATAASARTR